MNLTQYRPEDYHACARSPRACRPCGGSRHWPFVDHFYATSDASRLHLLNLPDAAIAGTLGLGGAPLRAPRMRIADWLPTNYYSLHPGWRLSVPALAQDLQGRHGLWRQRRHAPDSAAAAVDLLSGREGLLAHRAYPPLPGEARWKVAAKWLREKLPPTLRHAAARIQSAAPAGLTVREEHAYTEDLLPCRSPFAFRLAQPRRTWAGITPPSYPWLRLSAVQDSLQGLHRRLCNPQRPAGSVLVAQCDGDDPVTLAHGIALSVAAAGCNDRQPRERCSRLPIPRCRQSSSDWAFARMHRSGRLPWARCVIINYCGHGYIELAHQLRHSR